MEAITEIFRRYGDGCRAENSGLPAIHRKVIRAIQRCRTAESGSWNTIPTSITSSPAAPSIVNPEPGIHPGGISSCR